MKTPETFKQQNVNEVASEVTSEVTKGQETESPKNSSRRSFLMQAALAVPAAVAAQSLFASKSNAAEEMVSEKDPAAAALGFRLDATKVDTKKWPKRAGAEGAKQFCWTCALYQAKDSKNPKADAIAPCLVLGGKKVKQTSWCNSWAPNPNVKA